MWVLLRSDRQYRPAVISALVAGVVLVLSSSAFVLRETQSIPTRPSWQAGKTRCDSPKFEPGGL